MRLRVPRVTSLKYFKLNTSYTEIRPEAALLSYERAFIWISAAAQCSLDLATYRVNYENFCYYIHTTKNKFDSINCIHFYNGIDNGCY